MPNDVLIEMLVKEAIAKRPDVEPALRKLATLAKEVNHPWIMKAFQSYIDKIEKSDDPNLAQSIDDMADRLNKMIASIQNQPSTPSYSPRGLLLMGVVLLVILCLWLARHFH